MDTDTLTLDDTKKAQLDNNIKSMLSGGASQEDVTTYASDFKNKFGQKKNETSQPDSQPSSSFAEAVGQNTPIEKSESVIPFTSKEQIKSNNQKTLQLNSSNVVKQKLAEDFTKNPDPTYQKAYIDKLSEIGYDKDKLNEFAKNVNFNRSGQEAENLAPEDQGATPTDHNNILDKASGVIGDYIDKQATQVGEGAKQAAKGLIKAYNPTSSFSDIGTGALNVAGGLAKGAFGAVSLVNPEAIAINGLTESVHALPDDYKSTIAQAINPMVSGLPKEKQAEMFDKAIDLPFSAASTIANAVVGSKNADLNKRISKAKTSMEGQPKDVQDKYKTYISDLEGQKSLQEGSAGKATIDILDAVGGIFALKAVERGEAKPTIQDSKSLISTINKIKNGDATELELNDYHAFTQSLQGITPDDIQHEAQAQGKTDVANGLQDLKDKSNIINDNVDVSHHDTAHDKVASLETTIKSPEFTGLPEDIKQNLVKDHAEESKSLADNNTNESLDHNEQGNIAGEVEQTKTIIDNTDDENIKQAAEEKLKNLTNDTTPIKTPDTKEQPTDSEAVQGENENTDNLQSGDGGTEGQGETKKTLFEKVNEVEEKAGKKLSTEQRSDVTAMFQDKEKNYNVDDIVKTLNPDYKVEVSADDVRGKSGERGEAKPFESKYSKQPLQMARREKFLNSDVKDNGKLTTEKERLKNKVDNGSVLEEKDVPDNTTSKKLNAEMDYLNRNAPFGNENHPETKRLRELQAMPKSPFGDGKIRVMKKEVRLVNKDGSFTTETPFAVDYVNELLHNKNNTSDLPNVSGGTEQHGVLSKVRNVTDKREGTPSLESEKPVTPPIEETKEEPLGGNEGETFSVKNKVSEASAAKHGFKEAVAEATKSAQRDFGTVWESAKGKIDSKEVDVSDLRKKLANNPIDSGLNHDETNAILLHDQINLENELTKTTDAINSGKLDKEAMTKAQNDKVQLRSDLYDNFVASKKVGTEQGRGLNARKLLADREFSLSNMENELRAEQNGEPLTPAQEAYVAERYKAITEKAKEWDDFQKNKEDIFNKFREKVEKEVEFKYGKEGRTIIDGGKRIANGVRKLKTKEIFLLDDKGLPVLDKDGNKISLTTNNFYNEAIEAVAQAIEKGAALADAINKGIEHLRKQDFYKNLTDDGKKSVDDSFKKKINSVQEAKDSAKLEATKKRWETAKQKYRERRLREDYSTPERKRMIYDEEALRIQADLQHEKDLFYYAKEQARLSKLGWGAKALSGFNSLIREGLLSSPKTLAKLISFDLWRSSIIRPLYNAMSIPLQYIPKVKEIAAKATTEGKFNGKSLLKGEKAFIEKNTYIRMWDKLKSGGKSDLDLAFGDTNIHLPMMVTRSHGAVKQLGFQTEYNYIKSAMDEASIKAGRLDDPSVQEFNNRYAYAKGMDAIYMKDSKILKQYQLMLNLLENDKYGAKGKLAAAGARFLFPIVKVPYNFGKDVMYKHTPLGLTDAVIKSYKADVDKLTVEQADEIILAMKKGLLGSAVMAIGGLAIANNLGGLYSPDDKKGNNGLEEDEIKVGNTTLPAWFNHNVLTQAAQDGAEVAHLFGHAPKAYGTTQAIFSAILNTGKEQATQLPFYGELARDVKAVDSDKQAAKLTADKIGQSIPALVQWIAQESDTEHKEFSFHPFTKPRKVDVNSKTPFGELGKELQSKIPYLRNELPTKNN